MIIRFLRTPVLHNLCAETLCELIAHCGASMALTNSYSRPSHLAFLRRNRKKIKADQDKLRDVNARLGVRREQAGARPVHGGSTKGWSCSE